jgi:hypothetical protein
MGRPCVAVSGTTKRGKVFFVIFLAICEECVVSCIVVEGVSPMRTQKPRHKRRKNAHTNYTFVLLVLAYIHVHVFLSEPFFGPPLEK